MADRSLDSGPMSAPRGSRRAWNALPFSGNAPKSCFNHTCVVTSKSTLMMLGGETISNSTPLSDLHTYRSRQWAVTTRHNAPSGLSAHSSVAWGAKMMTFGGRTASGLSNDLHTYNEGTSHKHTLVPCCPERPYFGSTLTGSISQ